MKKKSICLLVIILLAAVFVKIKFGAGVNGKSVPPQIIQHTSNESAGQTQDRLTGYWELDRENAKEENILGFVTGLKIILPKEWQDEIIISVSQED